MPIDFSDLEDDFDAATGEFNVAKKRSVQERFPCPTCAGTGKYQGRRTVQEKSHCFACRGKGYFLTDPRKLAKNRQAAHARKASALSEWRADHADLLKALAAVQDWNTFAASLLSQAARKPLSERQVETARTMLAKIEDRKAERAAQRKASQVEVDLSGVEALFDQASKSGYKKPVFRAEGVKIKPGWRAGTLDVWTTAEYPDGEKLGWVEGGRYTPLRRASTQVVEAPAIEEGGEVRRIEAAEALRNIAADPKATSLRWGRRTGRCSCCGRELTKHSSIDAGIGPICAEKWGI